MAYATVAKPGTKFGPCKEECEHVDCAGSRATALQVCHYCEKEIGYDTNYCRDPYGDTLVHWVCAMEDAEKKREA